MEYKTFTHVGHTQGGSRNTTTTRQRQLQDAFKHMSVEQFVYRFKERTVNKQKNQFILKLETINQYSLTNWKIFDLH